MQEEQKYGILINDAAKINRQYFRECVRLLGIRVIYRAVKPGKKFTTYAEVDANYEKPILTGCLFHDHPTQYTMKKIGWVSELTEGASLIEVDYDLPGLQVGCLFIVPSGLDNGRGRVFRVTKMSNSMIYPSSITCELVPEYTNTLDDEKLLTAKR